MTSSALRLLCSALALSLAACAPLEDEADDDSAGDEVRAAGSYVRLRHDTRRCVSPVCGGFWVSRVNQRTLRCADGSTANECYVAEVDYSGLGLAPDAVAGVGDVILRGRLVSKAYGSFGNLGNLVVQEGWRAATEAASAETVYETYGTPRVCVRAPCATFDANKLNGTTSYQLMGVDLTGVAGVSRADRRAAAAALGAAPGILVAGAVRTTGERRTLVASQFYLRLSPGVSDAAYCEADADCTFATRGRPVASSADCYCALCPNTALNVSTAARYERDYQRYCAAFRTTCPVARCAAPPSPACVNHTCTAGAPR
ncbi:MAG: uncharacterized protein JWM10_3978 [Myxococcaceae bacterium]|nr:uncharacterized protein [Myxococcaceae bacterium]